MHNRFERGVSAKPAARSGRDERGVALLLTIFGLLLLTGVAVAMLFSSDSETMIAVNYRDKQVSSYAALSGLQEARDRLHPLYGDLATGGIAPTQLPGTAGQVLYIVNPNTTFNETMATVAPWSPTVGGKANPYFDKELCQENPPAALGLAAGALGTPCTLAPTLGNWYSSYDNSANNTKWRLVDAAGNRIPLDYKWVRITLKADNSAPVYVQTPTSAANGTQTCWDGLNQIQKPATAGTDCMGGTSGSSVAKVTLTAGGAGYSASTPPTVSFVGGGGSGAAATATLSTQPGAISSAALSNFGSGYSSSPTVTLVSPDGTGATLKALVAGSPVTGLSLAGTNYCYPTGTTGLTVSFNPAAPPTLGGTAVGTVSMTGQACISGFTASGSCASQKKNTVPVTSVPGGTGSGFSGTVTFSASGTVSSYAVTNVGSYTALPGGSQNVTVASGCTISISYSGGIKINSLSVTSGGEYISAPTASISGTSPKAPNSTQPTVNAAWTAGANNGKLSVVQVSSGGSGYAQPSYNLSITGGGGSGAIGTAASSSTKYVSGLTLTNGGSGYTTAPTVVISGPGAGAAGTATLTGGQQLLLGRVYMLTALAVTKSGSQSMAQMEVGVTPPWKFQLGGALTLAGPTPTYVTPNSNNLMMIGNDAAGTGTEPSTCNNTPASPLPAIGVYDNAAQTTVLNALGKPQNYIGADGTSDIKVTQAANPDPTQLDQMVYDISQKATVALGPTIPSSGAACTVSCSNFTNSSITNYGSVNSLQTIVVNGNLTLSGNVNGYGVLVITGNLTLQGNFSWNGVVLVLGAANVQHNGGGNGQITGAMYVANSSGGTLGSSNFNWSGGGTNTIQYDHCWADDLLNKYPPVPSDQPLKVLSTRMLEF